MSVLGKDWKVGHMLSESEVERLENVTGLDELIAVTTHPAPGVHFSDPYEGSYLLRSTSGQLITSEPNLVDPEGSPNQLTYLGNAASDEDLVRIATDFITSDDHEVAAAIHFHFNEASFGVEDWFWLALPEFYWFRVGPNFVRLSASLDAALKAVSPIYTYVTRFLDAPSSHEFEDFRSTVTQELGFSNAYEQFKYPGERG